MLSKFELYMPDDLLEACRLKAEGCVPVAGGTDVYVNMHGGKEKAGRHSVKFHSSVKDLHQRIVGVQLIARAGQGVAAFEAYRFLVLVQRVATGGANTWIKQVEDAMEPVVDYHK